MLLIPADMTNHVVNELSATNTAYTLVSSQTLLNTAEMKQMLIALKTCNIYVIAVLDSTQTADVRKQVCIDSFVHFVLSSLVTCKNIKIVSWLLGKCSLFVSLSVGKTVNQEKQTN